VFLAIGKKEIAKEIDSSGAVRDKNIINIRLYKGNIKAEVREVNNG